MDLPTPKASKLALVPLLLKVGFAYVLRALFSPFRGKRTPSTIKLDLVYSLTRVLLSSLPKGYVYYMPTTDAVYEKTIEKSSLKKNVVQLSEGSTGWCFGPEDAKYVMLFCHGGGYEAPAQPSHAQFQVALQKSICAAGHDFSIFTITYSLSHLARYPRQLQQVTEALRYLVEIKGRDPNTILISGDSAGANLACALILHLAKPHPKVQPLKLSKPLKGAVLISPWVSFDTTTQSFKDNAQLDYLTRASLDRCSKAFLGHKANHNDGYAEPAFAPKEWWTEVASNICEEILVSGGGGEILIDGIRTLANNVSAGYEAAGKTSSSKGGAKSVELDEMPNEAHEYAIWVYSLKQRTGSYDGRPTPDCKSFKTLSNWVSARL